MTKKIGAAIKKYRNSTKETQAQLAKKINKSVRMLQKYESGEVVPSLEVINDIAAALRIDADLLLGLEEEKDQELVLIDRLREETAQGLMDWISLAHVPVYKKDMVREAYLKAGYRGMLIPGVPADPPPSDKNFDSSLFSETDNAAYFLMLPPGGYQGQAALFFSENFDPSNFFPDLYNLDSTREDVSQALEELYIFITSKALKKEKALSRLIKEL